MNWIKTSLGQVRLPVTRPLSATSLFASGCRNKVDLLQRTYDVLVQQREDAVAKGDLSILAILDIQIGAVLKDLNAAKNECALFVRS